MKKLLCIGLLIAVAVCITACGWIEDEYSVVTPHNAPPPTEPEVIEVVTPSACNRSELRALILAFVRDGSARNEVDITGYSADLSVELPAMLKRLENNSLYAYAVDYLNYDTVERDGKTYLELNMVLRRSAEEIAGIISVRGMEAVEEQIILALEGLNSGLTVRVSGYQETDFSQMILRYCLEHPGSIVEIPDVSVASFPNSGGSRVLEFHFGYTSSKADIQTMRNNISTMLSSVSKFVERGEDTLRRYSLLSEYLVNRIRRESADGKACAYDLVCKQEATDKGFASVVANISGRLDAESYLVMGTRNGVPYCWNIIAVGDQYRHLDVMQQWKDGSSALRLLTDSEMIGYSWNRNRFPACFDPNAPDPEDEEEEVPSEDGSASTSEQSTEDSDDEPEPTEDGTESTVAEPDEDPEE